MLEPAGEAARIPGVPRRPVVIRVERTVGELGRVGLPEDDRAGVPEPGHDGGVLVGHEVAQHLGAPGRALAPGPAEVLDADRHAVKRARARGRRGAPPPRARASARIRSASSVMNAFSVGSRRSQRRRSAWHSSTGESDRAASRGPSSAIPRNPSSASVSGGPQSRAPAWGSRARSGNRARSSARPRRAGRSFGAPRALTVRAGRGARRAGDPRLDARSGHHHEDVPGPATSVLLAAPLGHGEPLHGLGPRQPAEHLGRDADLAVAAPGAEDDPVEVQHPRVDEDRAAPPGARRRSRRRPSCPSAPASPPPRRRSTSRRRAGHAPRGSRRAGSSRARRTPRTASAPSWTRRRSCWPRARRGYP